MHSRYHYFQRHTAVLLGALILLTLFAVDADAQRRRRRATRATRPVVTNPAIAPAGAEQDPNTSDERIISTVDEDGNEVEPGDTPATRKTATGAKPNTGRSSQQSIDILANKVDTLNKKLSQMEENERAQLEMERLTRAEQRTESLRAQLLDVETKLADLQPRLAQIEYSLKPENIERAAAGFGTFRPEEIRETRKRQLETELAGVNAQIRILEGSRTRLEAAIITADAEVDRLRRRLEARELHSDLTPPATNTRRTETPSPPQ